MAGKRPGKAGSGKRKPRGGEARKPARPPARPAAPVLGNDPFARGAAPRAPAPAVARPTASSTAIEEAARPEALDERAASAPAPSDRPRFDRLTASGPSAGPLVPSEGEGRGPAAESRETAPPAATATPSPSPTDRLRLAGERLGELERRMERTMTGLEQRLIELAARDLSAAGGELRETLARLLPGVRHALGAAADLARLLEPPGRLDRHGLDPRFYERAQPLLELLYATWWRAEARGLERVPASGAALVVANHAGAVPWDALVLRHALRRDHPARRDLRPLLDDREADLPLFGRLAIRLGAVRAAPEPAERLLREGTLVGVFPEGGAVARKPWGERYRITRFGRGGFAKLALRAGVPIIPCAIVGSEEASPAVSRPEWLPAALGLPGLPGASLAAGAAAMIPLPSRWSLRFGEPIAPEGAGPAAASDAARVNALAERVRATLQAMLDEELAARRSVYL